MTSFQDRCHDWAKRCIGEADAMNVPMRCHRFFEEASELTQALGMTREEAMQLVDYVWGRPAGEPGQEVGGVKTTLGTLCAAATLDMDACAERELQRVNQPDVIAKVRAKHQAKPKFGPLPEPCANETAVRRAHGDARAVNYGEAGSWGNPWSILKGTGPTLGIIGTGDSAEHAWLDAARHLELMASRA